MSKTKSTSTSQQARKQVVGADIDPRTGRPRTSGSSKPDASSASRPGGGADSLLRSIPVVGVAYAGLIDRGPGLAKGSLVVFTVGVALVMTVTVFLVSQARIFGFGEGSSAAAAASQLVVPVVAAVPVILGRGWQGLWRPMVLLVLSLLVQPAAVTLVLAAGFARIVWVELARTSVFAAASQDGRRSADSD